MDFLVVEDDRVDAEKLRRLMPPEVTLTHVSTLGDALNALGERRFNLVLLDLGLPDSSGIETFTTLREHATATPVVVLTGLDNEELAVRVIKEGAQDYLVKGFLDQRALRALGFAVERDRLSRELQQEKMEKDQLEEHLRRLDRQLTHMGRVALMGEVVGEIAHEVGQPLQAVANSVATIEKLSSSGKGSPEELGPQLEVANKGLEQTQGVLRRLRAFVRDSEPTSRELDVSEVVRSTLQLTEFERRSLDIDVTPELSESLPLVTADSVQIQQVMVNLLRNAFEAIGELVRERRRVTVRTFSEESHVIVEVEDAGGELGLPEGDLFAPFRTTKPDGLGMGLAICSRIIEKHQGRLTVSTQPMATVFRFELPEQS